jgi:L-serine dehydratase
MAISILDLFTVGIGPSSSHCVGPMRAARSFAELLHSEQIIDRTQTVRVQLYGSLALTGLGHGTDKAIVLGLAGETPETVNPDWIAGFIEEVSSTGKLIVGGREISFSLAKHLQLCPAELLPLHSNGMRFTALDDQGKKLREAIYYSVGGGFVIDGAGKPLQASELRTPLPYPYQSAADLLQHAHMTGARIGEIALQNESSFRDEAETLERLDIIWQVMQECVCHGCERASESQLPGNLHVRRRAPQLHRKLLDNAARADADLLTPLDWVDVFALAVSEENASGGRVVTAPTNGAAGIIPAVLHYYHRFVEGADQTGVRNFFLTAGAIGILYKQNASISGAEVGCQGEVGAACSMAAGALTEVLGGTPNQVEQAAEIAMEHHLGLTCDPVGGLVQIPCIERNAMAASHAIHASRLALRGDGKHCVSLDRVIETMRQTGADMLSKYKETSQGGLAVNAIEC